MWCIRLFDWEKVQPAPGPVCLDLTIRVIFRYPTYIKFQVLIDLTKSSPRVLRMKYIYILHISTPILSNLGPETFRILVLSPPASHFWVKLELQQNWFIFSFYLIFSVYFRVQTVVECSFVWLPSISLWKVLPTVCQTTPPSQADHSSKYYNAGQVDGCMMAFGVSKYNIFRLCSNYHDRVEWGIIAKRQRNILSSIFNN